MFSQTKTNYLLQKMSEKLELTQEQTITILAILFQQGGTTKKCDGNLTAKIFGVEIKLATIRNILKIEGARGGERKLARSLATPIFTISMELNLQGNLAKPIVKNSNDKEFTMEEMAWMSDFQNENPDCPNHIKTLINKYFGMKKQNATNSNTGKANK